MATTVPTESSKHTATSLLDAGSLPFAAVLLRANDGRVVYANKLMSIILRCQADKLVGKTIPGLFDDNKQRGEQFKLLRKRTFVPSRTITIKNFEHQNLNLIIATSIARCQGQLCLLVALQEPQGVERLEPSGATIEQQNRTIYTPRIGIWSWNRTSDHITWDDNMYALFGVQPGAFSGEREEFLAYLLPEDRKRQLKISRECCQIGGGFDTQFRILRPDGQTRIIMSRGEASQDAQGIVMAIVGVCWDMSENFASNARMAYQATHDPLTGLLNRFEMQKRIQKLLNSLQTHPTENTFCYFDLDRFKVINDAFGHEAGDELLRKISEHMKSYVAGEDTLARIGDDEFALIIMDCSEDDARKAAETLLQFIQGFHFEWEGKVFDINLSMALVSISAGQTVSEILGAAEVSLSAAKDSGRGRIHEYRPYDSTVIRRHDEMQCMLELEDALRSDRLQLYFQFIQPLRAGIDDGLHYEVLLRVVDDENEPLPTHELLNAAELYNMATRVDTWVVSSMFDWLSKHPEHVEKLSLCSINLSGTSIGDVMFLKFLKEKLKMGGVPMDKIAFEVTENAAIKNINKAREFIETIKIFGCKFSLDDFGSGHSSFAHLKDLPVDILKIDGMFVRNITSEPVNFAMVKAINDVGQIMKMKTIAEYVENEEVYNKLIEIGVDYGQGYYFSKSRKLDEVVTVHPEIAEWAN